jgi:hypothetical protein
MVGPVTSWGTTWWTSVHRPVPRLGGMLILDNPIGKASADYLLSLQMNMPGTLGVRPAVVTAGTTHSRRFRAALGLPSVRPACGLNRLLLQQDVRGPAPKRVEPLDAERRVLWLSADDDSMRRSWPQYVRAVAAWVCKASIWPSP